MPLPSMGSAAYNIANLAGAALAAAALGIPPATIAAVFARFGAHAADNPGRMMRFERGGVRVLVDYAHNPEGLRGIAQGRRASARRRPAASACCSATPATARTPRSRNWRASPRSFTPPSWS